MSPRDYFFIPKPGHIPISARLSSHIKYGIKSGIRQHFIKAFADVFKGHGSVVPFIRFSLVRSTRSPV